MAVVMRGLDVKTRTCGLGWVMWYGWYGLVIVPTAQIMWYGWYRLVVVPTAQNEGVSEHT